MDKKDDDDDHSLFFVEKRHLLKTVNGIFDSLLELTYEVETTKETLTKIRNEVHSVKNNIAHLKHILQKDLIIRDSHKVESLNLNSIKMSVIDWNNYINKSNTNSSVSSNNHKINSDDDSILTGENKMSSITTSNR